MTKRDAEIHEDERVIHYWRIATTMRVRNITQRDLAKEMGVTKQAVSTALDPRTHFGERLLQRIDTAITNITDKRGGLKKMLQDSVYNKEWLDEAKAQRLKEHMRNRLD